MGAAARPLSGQARTGEVPEGGTDAVTAIEQLRQREQALVSLLEIREAGPRLLRAAVSTLALCSNAPLVGIASFREHDADLDVEHVWHDGDFAEPFTWRIAPSTLRDIVGTKNAAWRSEVDASDVPGSHLLNTPDGGVLCCELISSLDEINGVLFRLEGASAARDDVAGSLIANHVSSVLALAFERGARRKSDELFNDVATLACDWFWEMDAGCRFTHISERWRDITGLDPEKYLGQSISDLASNPGDGRWTAFFDQVRRRRPIRGFGSRTICADGSVHYWQINAKPVFDTQGEFVGYRGTGTDVTAETLERSRAERAERLLRQAMEVVPQGFCLFDEKDTLVVANQSFREMHPEIADDLIAGADFVELVKLWSERTRNRPPDVSAEEFFHRVLKAHRTQERNFEYQRHDGRTLLINEHNAREGASVWLHTDISALKQREEELEYLSSELARQNAYIDATLNSMNQGLATFDGEDRLMVCNQRFREIFALPAGMEREGTPLSDIAAHLADTGLLERAREVLPGVHTAARDSGYELQALRLGDGRTFHIQITSLDNGDLLATFHETTELERKTRQLATYAEKLEFSNRELQEFAYVASHDLQEPLRKIEAFGDRLIKKYGNALDETGTTYLERMQNASVRMRTLVEGLLNYSRISTNARPPGPVDLGEVVEAVIGDLEVALESSGGKVVRNGLPAITADATQMRQLFQNLIANALKFRRPDVPPLVEVSANPVALQHGEGVEILVRDNGIGFESQHAEQIFKIFHRLHGRVEFEGTGIGLATCRKIAERHGGTISAAGDPGVGTTVTIVLPLQPSHLEESGND